MNNFQSVWCLKKNFIFPPAKLSVENQGKDVSASTYFSYLHVFFST